MIPDAMGLGSWNNYEGEIIINLLFCSFNTASIEHNKDSMMLRVRGGGLEIKWKCNRNQSY